VRNLVTSLLPLPLLVPLVSLSAQAPLPLEPGARVRITAPDCGVEKQATIFEALSGGTLVLGVTDCPLASVTRLELHAGRRVSAARALGFPLVGLMVGGVVGGLVGYSTCAPCDYELEGLAPAFGAALGGGVGLVTGLVVGLLPLDRWQEVPLEPLRVTPIASARGRFGLAASVRF
jgi:hypothetical protein